LILTSWRTRLRPEARRGFFFLGLADAIYKFFQCLRMMSSEPGILADRCVLSGRPEPMPCMRLFWANYGQSKTVLRRG
jgi:hypothetical protein